MQTYRHLSGVAPLAMLFGLAFTLIAPPELSANLLVNGDFEIPEDINGAVPTSLGDWAHDTAEIVTSELGVVPFSGSRMLKFIGTSPTGASATAVACEVMQLIDVSGFPAGTPLRASAYVNRVAGDSETDATFQLMLHAYSGDPVDFPSVVNNSISSIQVSYDSDGDASTWERLETATFVLPAQADYLELRFNAFENVFNDGVLPEFDGHYGDSVRVYVVPEPSAVCLALIGLAKFPPRRRNLQLPCSWHTAGGSTRRS